MWLGISRAQTDSFVLFLGPSARPAPSAFHPSALLLLLLLPLRTEGAACRSAEAHRPCQSLAVVILGPSVLIGRTESSGPCLWGC